MPIGPDRKPLREHDAPGANRVAGRPPGRLPRLFIIAIARTRADAELWIVDLFRRLCGAGQGSQRPWHSGREEAEKWLQLKPS
jgi:hypothetical protein